MIGRATQKDARLSRRTSEQACLEFGRYGVRPSTSCAPRPMTRSSPTPPGVRDRAKSLTAAAEQIATDEPAAGAWEAAYGRAKELARFALPRTPEAQRDLDLDRPSEPAITWWSAECGGIDAPQPASESASGAQSSGSTPLTTARAA